MLKILFTLSLLLFVLTGCGPRYVDYFPYHDSGAAKPSVIIVPVIDGSGANVAWDKSKEFTQEIRYQIRDDSDLYLPSSEEVYRGLASIGKVDFFANNIDFSNNFTDADFVVIAELIEHKNIPYNRTVPVEQAVRCHLCNSVLSLKMRVKVIDIRGRHPRIVLQEVIANSTIPPLKAEDAPLPEFGELNPDACLLKSFGVEHKRMIRIVVNRLEQVIRQAY